MKRLQRHRFQARQLLLLRLLQRALVLLLRWTIPAPVPPAAAVAAAAVAAAAVAGRPLLRLQRQCFLALQLLCLLQRIIPVPAAAAMPAGSAVGCDTVARGIRPR